jgi:hypothetical protein
MEGTPAKQGVEAAVAVIEALSNPNIDDIYTKLSFMVENPSITIDNIGDKKVGDTFTITGTTNLLDGQTLKFSLETHIPVKWVGIPGTRDFPKFINKGSVIIQKGEAYNTFSCDFDSTNYKPGTYMIQFESPEHKIKIHSFFELAE